MKREFEKYDYAREKQDASFFYRDFEIAEKLEDVEEWKTEKEKDENEKEDGE